MSDSSIEKSFLYLLVLSILLHAGAGALLFYLPDTRPPKAKEPVYIDLQTTPIPEKTVNVPQKQEKPREQPPKKQREVTEKKYYVIPKGDGEQHEPGTSNPNKPVDSIDQRKQAELEPSAFGLLKQKKQQIGKPSLDDLSLKNRKLSQIEEQVKDKLDRGGKSAAFGAGEDIDLTLASFYGRFLTSANSHLKTPSEARNKFINVRGKVDVTFNRKGEIIDIDIIKSGGKIFDEAVVEALNKSVVGSLPKAYKGETTTLPLLYFFQVTPQNAR